jgi:hypothetical protein
MSKGLAVKVEEIVEGFTGKELESRLWNEWTPRENRIFARRLEAKGNFGYVALTETERTDPTLVNLYAVITPRRGLNKTYGKTEMSLDLSVRDLDGFIDALIVARDQAIANWMIEPAW